MGKRVVIAEDEAIIRLDLREIIEEARDAGALAYLIKPFTQAELVPAIEVALGRFKEMQAIKEANASLEEQLATRRVVDRAKGCLLYTSPSPRDSTSSRMPSSA